MWFINHFFNEKNHNVCRLLMLASHVKIESSCSNTCLEFVVVQRCYESRDHAVAWRWRVSTLQLGVSLILIININTITNTFYVPFHDHFIRGSGLSLKDKHGDVTNLSTASIACIAHIISSDHSTAGYIWMVFWFSSTPLNLLISLQSMHM